MEVFGRQADTGKRWLNLRRWQTLGSWAGETSTYPADLWAQGSVCGWNSGLEEDAGGVRSTGVHPAGAHVQGEEIAQPLLFGEWSSFKSVSALSRFPKHPTLQPAVAMVSSLSLQVWALTHASPAGGRQRGSWATQAPQARRTKWRPRTRLWTYTMGTWPGRHVRQGNGTVTLLLWREVSHKLSLLEATGKQEAPSLGCNPQGSS